MANFTVVIKFCRSVPFALIMLFSITGSAQVKPARVDSLPVMQSQSQSPTIVHKPALGVSGVLKLSGYWFDAGLWVLNTERVFGMIKYSRSAISEFDDGLDYRKLSNSVRPYYVFSSKKYRNTLITHAVSAEFRHVQHRVDEIVDDPFYGKVTKGIYTDVTYAAGFGYEFNMLHVFGSFFLNYGTAVGVIVYDPYPFEKKYTGIRTFHQSSDSELPHLHVFIGAGILINQ